MFIRWSITVQTLSDRFLHHFYIFTTYYRGPQMDPITGDPKENPITEDPIENPITEDPLRTSDSSRPSTQKDSAL